MKDEKRCLNCRHEGKIHESQGWGGDEYWCECLAGMEMRNRGSFGCERWQKKPTELKRWSFSHGGMFQSPTGTWCELDDVNDVISDKDKEIAELKAKLENVQASMYCDVVDANMENRRLKRALWLARANRADGEFIYWCARLAMESGFTKSDICGYSVNTKRKLRTIGEWIEVWKNVKSKFLKKAEEYK